MLHRSGRTGYVEVRFRDLDASLRALAQVTMIERRD
jgi:hypothetical protein